MSTKWGGPGDKHDYPILASSRPEPAGQSCRGPATAAGGPGPFGITRDSGERRRAGAGRAPARCWSLWRRGC